MNHTSIEWSQNPDGSQGYSWNPLTGCLNQNDGLCRGGGFPCYAYKLAHGRLKTRCLNNGYISPTNLIPHGMGYIDPEYNPFYPRFWTLRLDEVLHKTWRKPRGVFVCDMSDLFGIGIPDAWTTQVINAITKHPESRFYLLTKQPQNLIKYSPYPENCWIGFTATNPDMFNKGLRHISEIKASVKFVSLEPLLDWNSFIGYNAWELLSWVIVGAQTPYNKRTFPKWEWIEKIIRDCDKCNTLVFLKNNLGLPKYSCEGGLPFYKPVGGTMVLRQELPYKVKEVMKHD